MGSQASLSEHGQDLWKTAGASLPPFIREIARALIRDQGYSKSRAIATAVSRCRVWAAGGDGVKPDTQAKAEKAIAQWDAARAKARATPNRGERRFSRPFDQGEPAGGVLNLARELPDGRMAFRYKHGWILINPSIPSRGAAGGALARKHGVKAAPAVKIIEKPGSKSAKPAKTASKADTSDPGMSAAANDMERIARTSGDADLLRDAADLHGIAADKATGAVARQHRKAAAALNRLTRGDDSRPATLSGQDVGNGWVRANRAQLAEFYGAGMTVQPSAEGDLADRHIRGMSRVHPHYHSAVRGLLDSKDDDSGVFITDGSVVDANELRERRGDLVTSTQRADDRTGEDLNAAVVASGNHYVIALANKGTGSVNSAAHELGHAVDDAMGSVSESEAFQGPWTRLAETDLGRQYLNPYFTGEYGASEGFAEAFAAYNTAKSSNLSDGAVETAMFYALMDGAPEGSARPGTDAREQISRMRSYFDELTQQAGSGQ